MVPVMRLGARSWDPSTARTGTPASRRRMNCVMAASRVALEGRACWKRSPATTMKSGFSSRVLSTTSRKAAVKSSCRASRLYCAYPRCRSATWTKLKGSNWSPPPYS